MSRSVSQPVSSQAQSPQPPAGGVWSDLASLQNPTHTSTLPLQYLSSATSPSVPLPALHLNANPIAGGTNLGATFATASPSIGLVSQGTSLGPGVSPGANALGQGVASRPVEPPFALGASAVNPFTQMAGQRLAQAQGQQNQFPTTSTLPFGSSLSQQPSFVPQVQQPAFSQHFANPFFNAVAPSPSTLLQPQASFIPTTPSPVPVTGSPFQPAQGPFQQQPLFQQPNQTPFQPQPPQYGNVQPSGGTVAGNPFTSWLTQQPSGYASAHVGQGGVNGQWGSM